MIPRLGGAALAYVSRDTAFIAVAALALMLLSACQSQPTPSPETAALDARIGDICAGTMTFDVTGPYFAKCQDYLRSHAQSQRVAINTTSKQAEHRACGQIGLAEGSPEYQSCVQEMYQLVLGAAHL